MLLRIAANKKSGKLLTIEVANAEELVISLKLRVSTRSLKALRAECSSETEVVERIIDQAYPNNLAFVEYDETVDYTCIRVYVFEPQPVSKPAVPKILIYLKGGLIQWVMSDNPIETLMLDGDVDITDMDGKNVVKWTDAVKDTTAACATHTVTNSKQPGFVRRIFKQVLRQLP